MKCKIQYIKVPSFFLKTLTILFLVTGLQSDKAAGQVFEVKKWTGTYPDMNGSYPLTFIAFNGGIIGIPHVFVRYWPTHNYRDVLSVPVIDATEISGKTKTDLAKTILKLIEQSLMKGRYIEKGLIKINTKQQKEIVQKIFEARFDQLGDIWELTGIFLNIYQKIDHFSGTGAGPNIKDLFKKEADVLFTRFLLVNLLESGHGQKIGSFGELKKETAQLSGEVDYTFKKLQFFEVFSQSSPVGYSFLTQ
jgi:hypothetical protein